MKTIVKVALGVVLGAILLIVGTGGVSVAEAARTAKRVERAGIDRALVKEARGVRCSRILVSTIDPTFARVRLTNRRGCAQGDGFGLYERRLSRRWAMVGSGPTEPSASCSDLLEYVDVNEDVARDLYLCGR